MSRRYVVTIWQVTGQPNSWHWPKRRDLSRERASLVYEVVTDLGIEYSASVCDGEPHAVLVNGRLVTVEPTSGSA